MLKRSFVMILFVTLGFSGGLVVTGRLQPAQESAAAASPDPAARAATPAPGAAAPDAAALSGQAAAAGAAALPDFTGVAARTMGAVVNISSTQVVRQPNSPFANDPFFRQFFGDDGYTLRKGTSAGSGVIISPDGYVLTNNHVVGEHIQQVTVILSDKRERPAKLVGFDPMTDLALLKIADRNLPTIAWGDSSQLKVAEWVLAIGNPYQLGQTVTLGIVSGINRNYSSVSAVVDYIQTDAAINPGNSGGALINRRGELVGINTWIYSESGGYQGIGFAVPANVARTVADELIKHGEVTRGTIGFVQTTALTPELAHDIGVQTSTKGIVVWKMARNTPAYQAGLRPGDVIQSVNGTAVDEQRQFELMLLSAPIGSVLQLKIIREGKGLDLRVPVIKDSRRQSEANN
jgi:Do/DeqQ family serine protease